MKLDVKKAKELAKKYLLDSGMEDGNFIYAHTEGVVFAASKLANKYNIDRELFEAIAWVHDIGQVDDVKNHAENSLKLLEKEDIELDETIKDCVLNHGNAGNPKTFEGKLISIADKISIIDRNFLSELILLNEISQEHIDFVKAISEKALEKLSQLNEISKI